MNPMAQTYALISSQKMVQYMWKYAAHMQATQIPCALVLDAPPDLKLLARVMNREIARNDCLRLRLKKTRAGLLQYFLPEYTLDRIPIYHFQTQEEQHARLETESARKLNVFRGETFRIAFFTTSDGRAGIYINVSHMVMDAMAVFLFFKDLLAVYDSLANGAPEPRPLQSYEAIVKAELKDPTHASYEAHETAVIEEFFKKDRPPTYCTITPAPPFHRPAGSANPGPIKPTDFFPTLDRTNFSHFSFTREESAEIEAFVNERQLSAEWVIQLGLRLFLSKRNHRVNDTVFWVLCPRRRTVKEKRCGGTMASPMPWREILPEELTFEEAIRQLSVSQSFLFRHPDVPFTSLRAMERRLYGYTPLQTSMSMMFSYLPLQADSFGGRGYEFLGFSMGRYVMPLYTITLFDVKSGCYKFDYIHRTHVYSDEDIRSFHEGVVRAILAGIRSPGATLGDLMDGLI